MFDQYHRAAKFLLESSIELTKEDRSGVWSGEAAKNYVQLYADVRSNIDQSELGQKRIGDSNTMKPLAMQ